MKLTVRKVANGYIIAVNTDYAQPSEEHVATSIYELGQIVERIFREAEDRKTPPSVFGHSKDSGYDPSDRPTFSGVV